MKWRVTDVWYTELYLSEWNIIENEAGNCQETYISPGFSHKDRTS